jgi:hypothetical protein
MAALATEAAFFGKPSIVCGYFASEVGRSLRSEQIAPSLFVDPSKLKSAIKTLIEQPDVRRSLGRSAQRFVREQWGVATVAERYMQLLNGSPDEAWWSDPYSIRYVAGCGLPLERAKRMVKTLLDTYGQESFKLSYNPELQAAFVAWLAGRTVCLKRCCDSLRLSSILSKGLVIFLPSVPGTFSRRRYEQHTLVCGKLSLRWGSPLRVIGRRPRVVSAYLLCSLLMYGISFAVLLFLLAQHLASRMRPICLSFVWVLDISWLTVSIASYSISFAGNCVARLMHW